jgi:hypothetical protein
MKTKLRNLSGTSCLIIGLVFLIAIAFSFFVTAGTTWLIMYGLAAIGVALPITWSWWVAVVVWLLLGLIGSLFK